MIFSSLEFIIFFLVFIFIIKLSKNYQREIIIISSFIFYSFWSPIFFFLLLYLCLSNYYFIKYNVKLKFAISISLIPLFYFKYSLFFINLFNFNFLRDYAYTEKLPLAISFITFTAIATIIDTRFKKHNENLNFKNFTEFLVFFPQLIAGPILRVKQLIPQLKTKISFSSSNVKFGLVLFTIGFIKKIFLADSIANYIDPFFQGLLTDHPWAAQIVEVMKPDFFDVKYLSYLTEKYFAYFYKYKCFPTTKLLISIIKDDLSSGNDIILRDQIVEFLHRMKYNPDMGDIKYVKDKALDFCKRQALKEALESSVDDINEGNYENAVERMKKACASGMPSTVGHDFFDDLEARFVKSNRACCPTGIDRLDAPDILRGGLGRGEIGVITANTGVGKSHWLVAMGANAMKAGKNVLHYTFELTEYAVGIRYDSNLCGIPSNDV